MKIKKEVQIGLLAIVAVALGYIGVNFLKGIEVFKKTSIYYAHFDNLSGISAAAPVEASGFKVGNVRSVASTMPWLMALRSNWRSMTICASP